MSSPNEKGRPRYLRLLPAVIGLSAVVLVLKSTDLVREAYAQAAGQVAALTDDPVPANKDYAGGDDDQVSSASEVDVVNSLAKRRRELDTREGQLNNQANLIAAAEARVDAKIGQLKLLQSQINGLLAQRDQAQKDQITSLVKTYSIMKPKDAARIFDALPDEVLLPVAQSTKPDILALILANMNSDNAKALTVKLASKLTLPQTEDAIAPQPAPSASTATAPTPAPAAQAAADEPAPAKKRARKPRPQANDTAPVSSSPAAAGAPATPTASSAPAAAAPQQNQAQPKT
jgi:flagellar motility protein MotE (MotC chaperone)